MLRRRLALVAVPIPAILIGCHFGPTMAAAGTTVSLRLKLPHSQKLAFHSEGKIVSTGAMVDSSFKVTFDTELSVKPAGEGTVKVRSTITNPSVSSGGNPLFAGSAQAMEDRLKGESFEAIYDERGKVTLPKEAMSLDPGKSLATSLARSEVGFQGFEYPALPVKVGSTWTSSLDLTSALGPLAGEVDASMAKIPVTYKVTSIFDEGGKRYASIESAIVGNVSIPLKGLGTSSISFNSNTRETAKVDVSTGIPVESKSDGTVDMGILGISSSEEIHLKTKVKD